jgi:membrane-associated protease RseP (regulator of RpoE activity)
MKVGPLGSGLSFYLVAASIAALGILAFVSPVRGTAASSASGNDATGVSLPQTGCAAWKAVGVVKLNGTTEDEGFSGAFTMTLEPRSGRYAVKRDFGDYSDAVGFDGTFAWEKDWSGASHLRDSAPAQALSTTRAWLRRRGWCVPIMEPLEIAPLSDESDSGAVVAVWCVTPPGGIPIILRFDRASGLLRQSELRLDGYRRLVQYYTDWQDIGSGVLIALSERNEQPDDESVEIIKVKAAKASARPPAAKIFAKPKQPHDYGVLGSAPSTTIPYEDDGIGRIFVPAFINGAGPLAFEVDTGGGNLILTSETAAQLHLKAVGNLSSTGVGAAVEHSGLVRTKEIRIGAAVIRNQVAEVLPMSPSSNDRGPRTPRAGVLGPELFARFAVQLDRTKKTMTLTPLENFKGTPRGLALPIRFTGSAPITAGAFGGIAGDFELDTGGAGPAIIEGFWAQEHGLAERLSHGIEATNHGVGGNTKTIHSRGDISIGPISLPHTVVMYAGNVERGALATHTQAGVIGESSLYQFDMTYDYGHEVVWIDPDPKAAARPYDRAGLRLNKESPEYFMVTRVIPNSPAELTGLKVGDKILSIDSRPASQMSIADAQVIFRGAVGSQVELVVNGEDDRRAQTRRLRLNELLP